MVWRGVVIAEGLADPTLINGLRVYAAQVSDNAQRIDYEGGIGRWHLYWVEVSEPEIDRIQRATLHGWYAHFWQGGDPLVVFDGARFHMSRTDRATWEEARSHGEAQGIPPDELDFPTDSPAG